MRNSKRFKAEWFTKIWSMVQVEKIGLVKAPTDQHLASHIEARGLVIPPPETISTVGDAIRYRIREWRKELMPKAATDSEYHALRLQEAQIALNTCFDEQTLKYAIGSIRNFYLAWLKKQFGGDPGTGLNNLSDPWMLRLRWLEPDIVRQYCAWSKGEGLAQTEIRVADKTVRSRITTLSGFIFDNSSNPGRSRRAKHDLHSPSLEALLLKYGQSVQGEDSSRDEQGVRSTKTAAREIMKVAGFRSEDDFMKRDGFQRLYETIGNGPTADSMSRAKPFFRWVADHFDLDLPPLYENQKPDPIVKLSQAQTDAFESLIGKRLADNDYELASIKSPRGLFRFILKATAIQNADDFLKMKPSDFISAAMWAIESGYALDYLKGIKAMSDALTKFAPDKAKWDRTKAETWAQFNKRVSTMLEDKSGKPWDFINRPMFSPAFDGKSVYWPMFFKILIPQYYEIARWDAANRAKKRGPKREQLVQVDYIDRLIGYLAEQIYGPTVYQTAKGAVKRVDGQYRVGGFLHLRAEQWTADKEREFEYLVGVALQVGAGLRFRSEAEDLKWYEKRPSVLTETTPSCIFPARVPGGLFWLNDKQKPIGSVLPDGEDEMLVFFINGSRKNDLTYLGALPSVAEEIIRLYVKRRGLKHGARFLPLSVTTIADHFKALTTRLFGHNVDIEEILAGARKSRALTMHAARNLWEIKIEIDYKGGDKDEVEAVVLGHKFNSDRGSDTSEIYAAFLRKCESHLPLQRRLKDLDMRSNEQVMHEVTQKMIACLDKTNSAAHEKTQGMVVDGFQNLIRLLLEQVRQMNQSASDFKLRPVPTAS